jgi:hypothetical protein
VQPSTTVARTQATGAFARDDNRVDAELLQMGGQGSAPENAGRGLPQYRLTGQRRYLIDQVVLLAITLPHREIQGWS